MATVPSTRTFLAGERVTAANLNASTKTVQDFLMNPPSCMVTATGAGGTIVTGGTPVKTVFNAELYDTDGMVDLNAYNQGFTVKTPGLYEIESSFGVNPASGNAHLLWMLLYPSVGNPFMTTTAYAPYASGGGSGVTVVTMKGMIRLTAGDQISQSLQVRNVTGTATTVSTYNSYNSTRLGARWIAV